MYLRGNQPSRFVISPKKGRAGKATAIPNLVMEYQECRPIHTFDIRNEYCIFLLKGVLRAKKTQTHTTSLGTLQNVQS